MFDEILGYRKKIEQKIVSLKFRKFAFILPLIMTFESQIKQFASSATPISVFFSTRLINVVVAIVVG